MSSTVGLGCGHGLQLLTPKDTPPDHGPWTLYPLIVEHPIEIGDHMTCIVCCATQTVTAFYSGLIPMNDDGKLRLP